MTILKPVIPGSVVRIVGETTPRIQPTSADTVAVTLVHDWGPVATDAPGSTGIEGGLQLCRSFGNWTDVFGDSDTSGRTATAGAFAGQNLPGALGAGGVLVARMAGREKAKASLTVRNTAEAPANALRLVGRYYGSRGNKFTVVIDADPNSETRDRLRVQFNGATVETYLYAERDVRALAESINARSKVVVATEEATGTALRHTTGESLAGGNDGATVTTEEHVAALESMEFAAFSILAPADVEDEELLAAYVSWTAGQDEASRPVRLVCGGAEDETVDDAIRRATACGDPHVVTLGIGTWHDDMLEKDLSTAQLAPRVAGVLAARGKTSSLTGALMGGLHPVGSTGPSSEEVEAAIEGGVTTFMRTSSPDAELRVAKGVTTWTTDTDALPVEIFGDPRLVGVMDWFRRQMAEYGDQHVVGGLVTDQMRTGVRANGEELIQSLLDDGLIMSGGQVIDGVVVERPFIVVEPPTDSGAQDTVPYDFGWQFTRTANFVLGGGRVR